MFSAILDVAIGMILLYLILSVVVSALNEFLSNLLDWRAKNLEYFIDNLLFSSPISTKEFYEQTVIAPQLEDKRRPAYIDAEDFAQAMLDLARAKSGVPMVMLPGETPKITWQDMQAAVAKLPDNSPLKKVLASALVKAEGDIEKVRANLASWYDNSMERVSGWYKSKIQYVLIILGMVIAVIFNIDTINYVNRLLENPALRSAIAAQAANVKEMNDVTVANLRTQLEMLNLPVGWDDAKPLTGDNFGWWLKKVLGIVMTGLAVSQGAPFWFDLLNKVTNLRSTGKPPDKAAESG
ncbi:MAG: hypothetical protein IT324_16460 [Anaerolineae bacterium]|nr:hypothetical protein [Anaerolineae bacterium]